MPHPPRAHTTSLFLPPFPASHPASIPKGKKARRNSRLLVVERGSTLSRSGWSNAVSRSVPRWLLAPQPRLCSKTRNLTKGTLAGWALCAPLLSYGTGSHDVLTLSQRYPSISSLWCFRAIKQVKGEVTEISGAAIRGVRVRWSLFSGSPPYVRELVPTLAECPA